MTISQIPARHSTAFFRRYISGRESSWQEVEALLKKAAGKAGNLSSAEVLVLAESYPESAADLAFTEREIPSQPLREHLSFLVGESYRLLYHPQRDSSGGFFKWFSVTLKEAVRHGFADIVSLAALFTLSLLVGYFFSGQRPAFGRLFVSPDMEGGLAQGKLWTESVFAVVPPSMASSWIITNNVSVTFAAFASGILLGLGSLYIVALNGLMLGAVVSVCAEYGMEGKLLEFISAHGPIEISAILLAAASGLGIARAIVLPGRLPRSEALQTTSRRAASVIVLTCIILVIAGVVESFVSPLAAMPAILKAGIGGSLFASLVAGLAWAAAGGHEDPDGPYPR